MITSRFGGTSTASDIVAGQDLSGRHALITGGAAGLGLETARALAAAGADVLIATRDLERGRTAAATMRDELAQTSAGRHHAQVDAVALDLASLTSVHAAVADVLARWSRLDLLVNNAGVMATPYALTEDGFETQLGTNHLGHVALTMGLLPALRAAAPARVVVLSSSAHRRGDVDLSDPNYEHRPYDKWQAYGQSKTANALFAVSLTAQHAGDGITANAVHPGGIHTGLQQHVPQQEWRALGWVDEHGNPNPMFKTVQQGAATPVWAAVGPELDGIGGLYLEDCQQAAPTSADRPFSGYAPYALDPGHAQDVWVLTQTLLAATRKHRPTHH